MSGRTEHTECDCWQSGWDAREPEVAELMEENERRRQCSNQEIASLRANVEKLEREVIYLRRYGNKDCTAMADEALIAIDEKVQLLASEEDRLKTRVAELISQLAEARERIAKLEGPLKLIAEGEGDDEQVYMQMARAALDEKEGGNG